MASQTPHERYIIAGGQQGKARLGLLARILLPTTRQLFARVGLGPGATCLDVGCGGGDVTLEMARVVGEEGRVCGFDFDAEILRLAQRDAEDAHLPQVEFRVADALTFQAEPVYDFVYARFLLTHVANPLHSLHKMIRAAKPGGMVVVEEIDFDGHFCHPPNTAFQRYVELYTQVAHARGGDPHIGRKVAAMFQQAGLRDVQVNLFQPVHLDGEGKAMAHITLARIGEAVVNSGIATQAHLDQTVGELTAFAARPDTLLSMPRFFQVWGRAD